MNNKVISMDKPKARRTFQVKSKLRLCLFVTFVLILMISLASWIVIFHGMSATGIRCGPSRGAICPGGETSGTLYPR